MERGYDFRLRTMSKTQYDFRQLRVMVVDDCRFMRMVLERMLDTLGVGQVMLATDGTDAWDRISEFEPDVIVTDWEMEGQDGPEFVRRLRLDEDSINRYIAVIMLTGYTEKQKVTSARDIGITEFLAKPVSARSLHSRLVAIIENPRPFVRTADFFGPCRRRIKLPSYDGPERRQETEEIEL